MKHTRIASIALAMAAVGSLATAQSEGRYKQDVKPVPASASAMKPIQKSATSVDLVLPVQGLTEENVSEVKGSLEKLSVNLYECSGCKSEFAKPGDCPACKKELTDSKQMLFSSVTTAADNGTIALASKPGMQVKLSEIERTLATHAVRIDRDKMTIPGKATLVVSGATTADQAKSIQSALDEAKLFQRAHAQAEENRTLIHVNASTTAPERAKVDRALTKAGPSFKITDVIWNDWTA
jgi:hypothetical protein